MTDRNRQRCLHCDQPVSDARAALALPAGQYCCSGCEAAAAFDPNNSGNFSDYDQPAVLESIAGRLEPGLHEADVLVADMRCGACATVIERHLRHLHGLASVNVNAHNHIVTLRWDQQRLPVSQILQQIAACGYSPRPLPLDAGLDDLRNQDRRAVLRLGLAGLGTMQVMMLSLGLYFSTELDLTADIRLLLTWAAMLLATPVVLVSGLPFFNGAFNDLRHRRVGMDVPVALAITAAYGMSVFHTLNGQGEIWFDSACMFVFFLSLGRHWEASGRRRAQQGLRALVASQPQNVTVITGKGHEVITLRSLQTGMRLLVRPGETFPADGTILQGQSSVDESLLTGESRPQPRSCGDTVLAGSLNRDQALEVRADKVGSETTRAHLMRLLRRAQQGKPAVALLADRIAGHFVLAVLLIATATALLWSQLDPSRVFSITLAVLVVTCPCALSLATPASLSAAAAALARQGLLVTRSHTLEALTRITHVVFDKTGTLTSEQLDIAQVRAVLPGWLPEDVLTVAAALEREHNHPIAEALRNSDDSAAAVKTEYRPGYGVTAQHNGHHYELGAPARLLGSSVEIPQDGNTWIVLTQDARTVGWIGLRSRLRTEARQAIQTLQAAGLEVLLMSGDHPATVMQVAESLQISQAEGGMLPEDKLAAVEGLRRRGASVLMVGDGLNDAPVLASADVSVAMQAGAALAQASADAVLLSGNLLALPEARELALHARRILRQNLAWAIGYNALAMPLAVAGLLTPWLAALGMSASSLLVVGNALRLLRTSPDPSDTARQADRNETAGVAA